MIKFLNTGIFSAEKSTHLDKMMNDLQTVWENASDEVMPFICRKKAQNVTVSVIVPVYNAEKFLTKALQSIVNQTLENIEIICVDDGSTDRSLEILNFFAAHDERITVITQPNSNAGVARNRALPLVTGKYFYVMDSDDWFVPHMLETAVNTAETEDCDIVVWAYQAIDDETKKPLREKSFPDGIVDVETAQNLFPYLSPCSWNKIFRTDLMRSNNLRFQEITNNNDASFSMCAIALAKKIVTLAEVMYFYRKSGTGLQATLKNDPFCCIQARIHSKNEMLRLGLMKPPYEKHFIDAFYHLLANQLCRMSLTLEQLIEVRTMLREHFDYSQVKIDDVIDKEAYIFIQSMFFSDEEFYPTKLITTLKQYNSKTSRFRKDNAALQAKCKKLAAANKKLTAANKKLKSGLSYRLGRALTWVPRKIRGAIKCLKQHGLAYTCKRAIGKLSGKH